MSIPCQTGTLSVICGEVAELALDDGRIKPPVQQRTDRQDIERIIQFDCPFDPWRVGSGIAGHC